MTLTGLRRLVHAATTLVLLVPYFVGWPLLRWALLAAVILAIPLEMYRVRSPSFRDRVARVIPLFRPHEQERMSGAFWLLTSYALVSWLAPQAAALAILIGGLGDPAASMVGARWGRGPGKTLPGSAAMLAVSIACGIRVGLQPVGALLVALLSTGAERWSGSVDDNILIGPVAALGATILA